MFLCSRLETLAAAAAIIQRVCSNSGGGAAAGLIVFHQPDAVLESLMALAARKREFSIQFGGNL